MAMPDLSGNIAKAQWNQEILPKAQWNQEILPKAQWNEEILPKAQWSQELSAFAKVTAGTTATSYTKPKSI